MMLSLQSQRQLQQICIDSYEGRYGEVKNILKNIKVIEKDNVKAFVGDWQYQHIDYIVVVFPGSIGLMDWIDNLKFKKISIFGNDKHNTMKIHQGFYKQYRKIKDKTSKEFCKRKTDDQKIIFIGHSLGGALATIFSFIWEKDCITFGSPRVGNKHFVNEFNRCVKDSYRIINGEDSVCKVPTFWMNYRHVKGKIKIGQKLSWREKLLWLPRKIFGNPADHYPQRYLENIGEYK